MYWQNNVPVHNGMKFMEWKSDIMLHFSSIPISLLFNMSCRNGYPKRRSGLAAFNTDGPFFHLHPVSVLMWRWSTILPSSPGCPWGVSLKTDQWPSQVTSGCSPDLWLFNCKLWCITGQGSANDFACIKHLAAASSKGHLQEGPA